MKLEFKFYETFNTLTRTLYKLNQISYHKRDEYNLQTPTRFNV